MKLAKPQEVKRTIKVIQSLSRYLEPKNVNLRINEKGKVSLLNIMLQIYEKTEPKYKEKYEQIEEEEMWALGSIKAELADDYDIVKDTMQTVKDESYEFYDVRTDVFNMFYANKIAHKCKDAEDYLIGYIYSRKENPLIQFRDRSGRKEHLNPLSNQRAFDLAYKKLHSYFTLDPTDVTNNRQISKLKYELTKFYGITENDFEYLENNGFRKLANTNKNTMYIKDASIASLKDELVMEDEEGKVCVKPKYENLSFGVAKDNDGQHIFAIDLPGHQQISVHVKDFRLIGQINSYPYKIIERRNVLIRKPEINLSETRSVAYADGGLEGLGKVLAKDNLPKEGHRIMVAYGAGRDELDDYYTKMSIENNKYYPTYPARKRTNPSNPEGPKSTDDADGEDR